MIYLTDKIYRESKPDAFQELYALPWGDARRPLATQLQAQGYKINVPLDVWDWDAGNFMAYAQRLGLTTVPAMNEALPGSIPVSVDAADYPPAHPATPVPTPTSPIGPLSGTPGTYGVTQAAFNGHGVPFYAEGQSLLAPNGETVFFHAFLVAPFGFPGWQWETAEAKARREAAEGTAIDNTGQKTGGAV